MTHALRMLRMPLFAAVALLALAAGCSKDDTPTTPPSNNTVTEKMRPTVFVHGFLEAADAFTPMAQLFALNGYAQNQLHQFDFEGCISGTQADVAKMTDQFKAFAASVKAQTGSDRIDIVAHGIGAQAVQQWLVKHGGIDVAAHVIFLGGQFDAAQTLNGSLTPSPCKYLALRSDGKDATQAGDAAKGTLQGADNRTIAGADHQQLLASSDVFTAVYTFCTGADPTVKSLPASMNLQAYTLRFRVITAFDNTPVSGATVVFRRIKKGTAERQVTGVPRVATSDAQGYVALTDTVNPYFDIEISVGASGYHDMHIYRQSWRANSQNERLRILPKSGGSAYVQAIVQGFTLGSTHSLAWVFSPYRAIYNNRDRLTLESYDGATPPDYYDYKKVELATTQTAPAAGVSAQGSNTVHMFVFDVSADKTDGAGSAPAAALNTYGVNSYDAFMNATNVSLNYSKITFNAKTLALLNFKSQGSNPNNGGISILQFDYSE